MQSLTHIEQEAYNFIVQYFAKYGFSPSYQEIADGIYYSNQSSVYDVLRRLKRKGYIDLPFKSTARAIKVVGMKHIVEELD